MRLTLKLAALAAFVVATASVPAARSGVAAGVGPKFTSIGPLAFGPDGMLLAGDPLAGTVYALDLGNQATGGAQGTQDVQGIDQKIAEVLGTDAAAIRITDLAVHPRTRNAFVSVMRGVGADAQSALMRIDGAGKVSVVSFDAMTFTSVALPNPANVTTSNRGGRAESITDLGVANGRVFVAGLSNEEFSSKLWSVPYPFAAADRGTSVEIFHGNHGRVETQSPVYAFIPYTIDNQPYLIGAYLCTPLVKFGLSTLKAGDKVRGTTIAELGAGNRPIDMVLYKKDGKEFLLMSNTSRGVMKIPTATFGSQAPITEKVATPTGGVPYETVASMTGIEQLDLLDGTRTLVIAKAGTGTAKNLQAVILP